MWQKDNGVVINPAINLSILDFKLHTDHINIKLLMTINLSILDFK